MIYMRHLQSGKYLILWMEQDIFGVWCVYSISGNEGGAHSRQTFTPCDERIIASQLMGDLEYKARQRGFIYDDVKMDEYFALRPQILIDDFIGAV